VGVYTLLDREEGGRERLQESGYRVRSIFLRSDLLASDGRALELSA
jgi:orotate phosphoribosyltransferase